MQIGKLDKRISILKEAVSHNNLEAVKSYSELKKVFASVSYVSDSEKWRANSADRSSIVRFVIRKSKDLDLDNSYRIQYRDDYFDVIGVKETSADRNFIEITASQIVERKKMVIVPPEPPYVAPSLTVPAKIIRENGVLRLVDGQYSGEFTHVTRTLTVVRPNGLTDLTALIVDGVYAGELDTVGGVSVFTFETIAHGKRSETIKSSAQLEIEARYVPPYVITPAEIAREADDRLTVKPATFGGAVQSVTNELSFTLLDEVTIITPIIVDGAVVGEIEHVEGPTRYTYVSTAIGSRDEVVTSLATIEIASKYVPIAVATETGLSFVDGKLRITPATFNRSPGMVIVRLFKLVDGERVSVSHDLTNESVYTGNLIFREDTTFIAQSLANGEQGEQALSEAEFTVPKRQPATIIRSATITPENDGLTVAHTVFANATQVESRFFRVVDGREEDLALSNGFFAGPVAIHQAPSVYRFRSTATDIFGDILTDEAELSVAAFYHPASVVNAARLVKQDGYIEVHSASFAGDVDTDTHQVFMTVDGIRSDVTAEINIVNGQLATPLRLSDANFELVSSAVGKDGGSIESKAEVTIPAYIPITLKTPGKIIVSANDLEFVPAEFDGEVIDVWTQLVATENGVSKIITSQLVDGKITIVPKNVDVTYEWESLAFGRMNEDVEDHAYHTVPAVVPISVSQSGKIEKVDNTLILTDAVFSGDVSSTSRMLTRGNGVDPSEDITHLIEGNTFPGPTALDKETTYTFVSFGYGPLNSTHDVVQLVVEPLVIGPIGAPIAENTGTWSTITDPVDGHQYRLGIFEQSASVRFTRAQEVQYLIIAGGGGASTYLRIAPYSDQLGGAGAGGLLQGSKIVETGTYPITVGVQGWQPPSDRDFAFGGGDSVAFGITAFGGGRGGSGRNTNNDMPNGGVGGSGGGACGRGGAVGGQGVQGQGFNGGNGAFNHMAGGGGAGSAGGGHTAGKGLQLSFTGEPKWYSCGGRPTASTNTATYAADPEWLLSQYGSGSNGGNYQGGASWPPGEGKPGVVMIRYRLAS